MRAEDITAFDARGSEVVKMDADVGVEEKETGCNIRMLVRGTKTTKESEIMRPLKMYIYGSSLAMASMTNP